MKDQGCWATSIGGVSPSNVLYFDMTACGAVVGGFGMMKESVRCTRLATKIVGSPASITTAPTFVRHNSLENDPEDCLLHR